MKFFKYILVFGAGAALGAVVTRKLLREKYDQIIEDEVNEVVNYYKDKLRRVEDAAAEEVKNISNEPCTDEVKCDDAVEEDEEEGEARENVEEQKLQYKKLVTNYSAAFNQQNKPKFEPDPAEEEYPEEDEEIEAELDSFDKARVRNDDPYIITIDDYNTTNSHYDKITVTYYSEDDVLADENEEIISDPNSIIGEDALLNFGEGSDDADIVYVRNEKIAVDYEVIRVYKSYSRDILGIDDESIRPVKRNLKKGRMGDEEI